MDRVTAATDRGRECLATRRRAERTGPWRQCTIATDDSGAALPELRHAAAVVCGPAAVGLRAVQGDVSATGHGDAAGVRARPSTSQAGREGQAGQVEAPARPRARGG